MLLPAQTADSACGICAVQALVDALDTEASAENLDSVKAQLTAIDQAMMEFNRALKNRTAQGLSAPERNRRSSLTKWNTDHNRNFAFEKSRSLSSICRSIASRQMDGETKQRKMYFRQLPWLWYREIS